jgi:translation initiation factor 2 alpha subunit (eIF-2alpha)
MKEDELVLCTVEKVTNTITFVRLPDGREGTIISSEIAPGRIKFMRQYVVPNKKIVCKVLKIEGNNIHLSLRRVNNKEKKEVMQRFKQEQAISVSLKQILGKESEEIKEKILKDFENLTEFADKAKNEEKILEKYVGKKNVETIRKIIDKKRKKQEIRHKLMIKCLEDDGIKRIKKILEFKDEEININYLGAGEFLLKLIVEDFKQGKKKLQEIIEEIEKRAKKENCEFNHNEEK